VTASPAEQAAAEAVARDWNLRYGDGIHQIGADVFTDEGRAVVAALRPLIEADALESLAGAADSYGPPTAEHLRAMAFVLRQGRMTVHDWLAADTTRSTTPTEGTDPR